MVLTPVVLTDKAAVVGSGDELQVRSTTNLSLINTFTGHKAPVLSLRHHPYTPNEVLSFSEDGVLIHWNVAYMKELNSYQIGDEVWDFVPAVLDFPIAGILNQWVTEGWGSGPPFAASDLVIVTVQRNNDVVIMGLEKASKVTVGQVPGARLLSTSKPTPSSIAVAHENNVYFFNIEAKRATYTLLRARDVVTALACHHDEPGVAVGDYAGRIQVWKLASRRKPTVTMNHWHAHAVSTLEWSKDGVVLLSGGEEAVLCLWNTTTWDANRIPRLGGPISKAVWSTSNRKILTACLPGTLVLVDVLARKPSAVVHGTDVLMGQPCEALTWVPSVGGGCVALLGLENMLRLFDPRTKQYVTTIQMSPGAAISKKDDVAMPRIQVKAAVFSEDGQHLATVEETDMVMLENTPSDRTTLRFWNLHNSQSWVTNTFIASPHSSPLTAVLFTSEGMAVTVGGHGELKSWRFSERLWSHLGTASFGGDGSDDFSCCAAISPDKSIVLVGTGPSCTAVTSASLAPVASLHQHLTTQPLQSITFASHTRPLVAARSKEFLFLWDLVQGALLWSIELRTDGLAPIPPPAVDLLEKSSTANGAFLVTASDKLLLFAADSPSPIGAMTIPKTSRSGGKVSPSAASPLVVPGRSGYTMVYVNEERQLAFFDPSGLKRPFSDLFADHDKGETGTEDRDEASADVVARNVASIFSVESRQGDDNKDGVSNVNPTRACKVLRNFYSTTTHTLPSPSATMEQLLGSLLTPVV